MALFSSTVLITMVKNPLHKEQPVMHGQMLVVADTITPHASAQSDLSMVSIRTQMQQQLRMLLV